LFLVLFCRFDPGDQCLKVSDFFLHPALFESLIEGRLDDLSCDGYASANISGLRLGPAHSSEARGDIDHSLHIGFCEVFACGVEEGERGAVDDALRADVAEAASGHLAVYRAAVRVQFLVHLLSAVVRHHHPVGDDHPRVPGSGGIQALRMARHEDQCLFLCHVGQVVQDEVVLRPVGENRAVSAVGDEFFGKLGDFGVEVVHDIVDDALGLRGLCGVVVERVGHDAVVWLQAVHVDVPVVFELRVKLLREQSVQLLREVPQCVSDCLLFLAFAEVWIAFGGVGNVGGPAFQLWQRA